MALPMRVICVRRFRLKQLQVALARSNTPLSPENSLLEIRYFRNFEEKGKEHGTEAQTFSTYMYYTNVV